VAKLQLVVFHLLAEITLPLVLLIFLRTAPSLALEQSLVVRARGDLVGVDLLLLHILMENYELVDLLAVTTSLE